MRIFPGPSNPIRKEKTGQAWMSPAFNSACFEMDSLTQSPEKVEVSKRYTCQASENEIIKVLKALLLHSSSRRANAITRQ